MAVARAIQAGSGAIARYLLAFAIARATAHARCPHQVGRAFSRQLVAPLSLLHDPHLYQPAGNQAERPALTPHAASPYILPRAPAPHGAAHVPPPRCRARPATRPCEPWLRRALSDAAPLVRGPFRCRRAVAVWMHGAATPQALCRCNAGWRGVGCELRACPGSTSGADGGAPCGSAGCVECSGHGSCDASTGVCACSWPWSGAACDVHGCGPLGCGAHGRCLPVGTAHGAPAVGARRYACACETGWTGEDCSLRACAGGCGDAGWCHNGTCICHPGSEVAGSCSPAAAARKLSLDCSMRCVSGCADLCARGGAATPLEEHDPFGDHVSSHVAMLPLVPGAQDSALAGGPVACEAECSSRCLAICATG